MESGEGSPGVSAVASSPHKECSVEWCDRPSRSVGLCKGHYQRLSTGVDLDKPWRASAARKCAASPTCRRSGHLSNRNMCGRHYEADQRRRRQRGEWTGYMPAEQVNDHVATLLAAGVSMLRIAQIADLSITGVRKLRGRQRIWRKNGERILAIRPEGLYLTESGFVSVIGPARRLQALIALGYSQPELASRLSLSIGCVDQVVNGRTSRVCMATARAIDKAFREMQLEPPPPSRWGTAARNRATRKGWALPLAWEEDSIDDPLAQPFGARTKKPDWWPSYLELREFGLTVPAAADRLGVDRETMKARIRREAAIQREEAA